MKKSILAIAFLVSLCTNTLLAQSKRVQASAGRAEYIEVEKNVKLHVTDLGEGQPIVLIHGWPLSDAMYEYQYQYLSRGVLGLSVLPSVVLENQISLMDAMILMFFQMI